MNFTILGQGTALPEQSFDVDEGVSYAEQAILGITEDQKKKINTFYRHAGIDRRYSVLLRGDEGSGDRQPLFRAPEWGNMNGPPTSDRLAVYEQEAPLLAIKSSREALEQSGLSPNEITHMVTVSCSGFSAPGTDIQIIKELGLPNNVERANIGFMGCHGAMNGLKVASGFCKIEPEARVLLCATELCSIHFQYGYETGRVLANALFSDGSAAVVGGAQDKPSNGAWQVAATGSYLIPDSEDAMTWHIGDHGFTMTLAPSVPGLIGAYLSDWLDGWLGKHGFKQDDVKSWAVHPGGPAILDAVVDTLSLPLDAVDASREVLRDYGNMSSPTVLFVLKKLREEKQAQTPCVALGFGPGLYVEAALFV
jgi:predicted naringenin-chalcone synthase